MLVKNLDILWPYSFFLLLKKGDVPPAPPGFIWKNGEAGGIFTALQVDSLPTEL